MKLFISWSGQLSHQVAVHLRDWLPAVLPFVDPWVSSEDLRKGSRWGNELANQLETTNSGIICIVPGNLNEPWLNFEAGALSKSVAAASVHPLLVGLDARQLEGPLVQFQATQFVKEDVRKLIKSLNAQAGKPVAAERLDRNFDICWPDLERSVSPVLVELSETVTTGLAVIGGKGDDPVMAEQPISDDELAVLRIIANEDDGLRAEAAGELLGVHPQRAQYLMEQLEQRSFLDAAHNYLYGTSWHLSKVGRALLVKHNLL